jgi:hypothetical protein
VREYSEDLSVAPPVAEFDVLTQTALVPHSYLAQHGDGRNVASIAGGLDPVKIQVCEGVAHRRNRHARRQAAPPGVRMEPVPDLGASGLSVDDVQLDIPDRLTRADV